MFEVIIVFRNDWIDFSGVPDLELFKALSDWSSGENETITLNGFVLKTVDVKEIRIIR